MSGNWKTTAESGAVLLALAALAGCAAGPDDAIVVLYQSSADANRGGQLWDEWWKVADVQEPIEPGGTALDENGDEIASSLDADNPYFMAHVSADNSRDGSQTWRCKECHGWDYKGADGAYGSGSHHTGFAGVTGAAEKSITDLYAVIARGEIGGGTETGHAFNQVMSDQDIVDLIAFVREGILDDDAYIDPSTKLAIGGDVEAGNVSFNTSCATCHGVDGDQINFEAGEYESEFIADIATDNPWEIFHKIRFGQPGESMPDAAAQAFLLDDVVSVLAYTQTLGDPELNGHSAWRGGVLYDKWWKVTGGDEPAGTNPLYADSSWSQGTKSGSGTWRCKECHGWDYKGVDGRYGSGSHYTGIAGLFGAVDKPVQALYDTIYSGVFTDADGNPTATHDGHAFGDNGYLSSGDVMDLVRFVKEALVDDDDYIDGYTTRSLGSEAAGKGSFLGNCGGECHNTNGTAINFAEEDEEPAVEYIGVVARDNPWEAFHKIRFGQPGSDEHVDEDGEPDHMPNSLDAGYTLEDDANILAYAQSLPDSVGRGGQLWDKWWDVIGVTEPIEPGGSIVDEEGDVVTSSIPADNPYYMANRPDGNTRDGSQTWRCKECHGWDYKGADGVYGHGSHYTGFPGIFDAHLAGDEAAIYDAIANGPSGMSDSHAFLPLIGEAGVRDLVNFVIDGVIDTSECLTPTKEVADYDPQNAELRTRDANWAWGQMDFDSNCAQCHGLDGQAINFDAPEWEVVGSVAADNPWELLHKIRFAQPGGDSDPMMPSAAGRYYTLDDVMDIVSYAMTLPED